jgi:KAP family P-loop domain
MATSKYKFLDDRPVDTDAIGHYNLIADQLFETIHCNLNKPFVIGLFGSWGTGKSSIIEMLKFRCKKNEEKDKKTEVVVVDAWRKDKDIFRCQFLKKLAKELLTPNDSNKVCEELDKKITTNRSKIKQSDLAIGLWVGLTILVLILIIISCFVWHNNLNATNPFPVGGIVTAVLAWVIASYFQWILPSLTIKTGSTEEDITLHDIEHFRKLYFDKIIGKTKAKNICVVVDNLDRVEAEDALAIIRTLKTFIVDAKEDSGTKEAVDDTVLNKAVFIVPCCDKELKEHVKRSKAVDDGDEFLNKFFNVSFRIPEFRTQDAFQYAREQVENMGLDFKENHKSTICHVISKCFGKNPRKAKIFLNNFLMFYNVAEACEFAGKIEDGVVTAHPDWLAINMAFEGQKESQSYFEGLKRQISPDCLSAMKFLKKPNDFDTIPELDELLIMASSNDKKFTEAFSKRVSGSQKIIDALWQNIDVGDHISQVNTIASVVKAIEANCEIVISPFVKDQMAKLLSWQYPQKSPNMNGKLVYEKLLIDKPKEIIGVIEHIRNNVDGISLSEEQVHYCVDILEVVLKDIGKILNKCRGDEKSELKQGVLGAIELLAGLNNKILSIAIKHPEFKSIVLFNQSLERCSKGYLDILPNDVINYCMALENTTEESNQFIKKVIECFDKVLRYFQDEAIWVDEAGNRSEIKSQECTRFLSALRDIIKQAYDNNMQHSESEATLETVDGLFVVADDDNKFKIIELLVDFDNYTNWSSTVNLADSLYDKKCQELLKIGSEHATYKYIDENARVFEERFFNITFAGRFKSVCHLILEKFPERRDDVVVGVWGSHKHWITEWIEKNAPKLSNDEKAELQQPLINIALQNNYCLEAYSSLKNIKVGNIQAAKQERQKHFQDIINSRQPLSVAENLKFILERIDAADYKTTNQQNQKLAQEGRDKIDSALVDAELSELIKNILGK